VMALALALAYVVAVWAMTGKAGQPGLGAAATTTPSAQAGKGATTVNVVASEFDFTLSKTSLPHGNVVFTMVNKGKLAHDFSIGGKTTSLVAPGKSVKLTVVLNAGSSTRVANRARGLTRRRGLPSRPSCDPRCLARQGAGRFCPQNLSPECPGRVARGANRVMRPFLAAAAVFDDHRFTCRRFAFIERFRPQIH
jgi:hypothetical protein